jgi:hypothetical protein
MGGTEHRVFNRGAGECRPEEHSAASVHIVRLLEDGAESACKKAERFARVHERKWVAMEGDRCLKRVCNRVDPGDSGDANGLRAGEGRVENGDACSGLGVAAGHFDMADRI